METLTTNLVSLIFKDLKKSHTTINDCETTYHTTNRNIGSVQSSKEKYVSGIQAMLEFLISFESFHR